MPNKTTPAEWLLARLTNPTRAAAILGDLSELSTTRGRLWFWTAYTRTLIALGWRTPVAFLCAYAFSTWVAIGAFPTIHSLLRRFDGSGHHPASQTYWQLPVRIGHHSLHANWQIPLGNSLIALWFILPFVLVRFGLRDRLAQLASAIFLLTIPCFSLLPAGVNFAGFVTAILIVATLSLRNWRRPMIVLAASIAPVAIATLLSPKIWYLFLSRGYTFASPQLQRTLYLYRALELCIAVLVCFLPPPPPPPTHAHPPVLKSAFIRVNPRLSPDRCPSVRFGVRPLLDPSRANPTTNNPLCATLTTQAAG